MDNYLITVAEPWNFEGPDGKNKISGKILSIANKYILVFRANHELGFNDVSGNILVLSPRSEADNFDEIETKEVEINGGLLLTDYNGVEISELENNCQFVLIGTLTKQ